MKAVTFRIYPSPPCLEQSSLAKIVRSSIHQDYPRSFFKPFLGISSVCRITSYASICVSLQSSCLLSRALALLPAPTQNPLQPSTTLPDPSPFCSRSHGVRRRVPPATAVLIFRIREVLKLRARILSERHKPLNKDLTHQPGYLRYKRLPKNDGQYL
jgi:hypothetical protein